jgi:hypothetical protein
VQLTSYVRVGIRLDNGRLDLGVGHFGDRLHNYVVNVIQDKCAPGIPVAITGATGAFDVNIGPWQHADDIEEAAIDIRSKPLALPVGTHSFDLKVQAGDSSFPLTVDLRIEPLVIASPPAVDIDTSAALKAPMVVKLTSPGHAVVFDQPTTTYNRCKASLTTSDATTAAVSIEPIGNGINDFDIVQVNYRIPSADRTETVSIPVSLHG